MLRNCFVFLNSIGHYFNIVYVSTVRAGQPAVSVQGGGLFDVALECGVPDLYTSDGVATNKQDRVTRQDPVTALQWELRSAGVWEAYVMAPGKEVNLPGPVSNCLLAVRGSV